MSGLDDLFKKAAKAEPKPEQAPVTQQVSNPKALKSMPGFGGFGKPKQSTPVGTKNEEAKPTPASETAAVESPQQVEPVSGVAGAFAKSSGFPDEVPATSVTSQISGETPPDRDLTGADESVQRFLALLDGVHGLTPDPRLATDAIKGIMIELKNNRQYIKHVQPEDVRVMIRLMRENMGLAKIAKAETKAKRSVKKEGQLKDDLASLGIDLGGI